MPEAVAVKPQHVTHCGQSQLCHIEMYVLFLYYIYRERILSPCDKNRIQSTLVYYVCSDMFTYYSIYLIILFYPRICLIIVILVILVRIKY